MYCLQHMYLFTLSSGPAGGEILGLTPRYPWLALTFLLLSLFTYLLIFFLLLLSLIIPFWFPVFEWILLNTEMLHSYFSLNCIPPITPNRLCGPMIASAVKGLPCQLKRNRFLWPKIGYHSVAGRLGLSFSPIVWSFHFSFSWSIQGLKYNDNVSDTREKVGGDDTLQPRLQLRTAKVTPTTPATHS